MYYIQISQTEHVLEYVLYSNQSDWESLSLCIQISQTEQVLVYVL